MPIRAGPFLFSSHLSHFEVLLLFCYRSITTPVTTPLYANSTLKKVRLATAVYFQVHSNPPDPRRHGWHTNKILIGG